MEKFETTIIKIYLRKFITTTLLGYLKFEYSNK